jgi:hypothetical protein
LSFSERSIFIQKMTSWASTDVPFDHLQPFSGIVTTESPAENTGGLARDSVAFSPGAPLALSQYSGRNMSCWNCWTVATE